MFSKSFGDILIYWKAKIVGGSFYRWEFLLLGIPTRSWRAFYAPWRSHQPLDVTLAVRHGTDAATHSLFASIGLKCIATF